MRREVSVAAVLEGARPPALRAQEQAEAVRPAARPLVSRAAVRPARGRVAAVAPGAQEAGEAPVRVAWVVSVLPEDKPVAREDGAGAAAPAEVPVALAGPLRVPLRAR